MANVHHIRPANASEEVELKVEDLTNVRALREAGQRPAVLVLSRDLNLVETVRKAAPRGTLVTHSPDLDRVADKLPSLKPGVLLVDTASVADVASMLPQLTQHFPELVVVVAGKREDSAALMQLTAAGRIFRFLLTPLSHGQTHLALEAAIAQHAELRAAGQRLSHAGSSDGGNKNYVVAYGALAAGLVVVIGAIWFGVKMFTAEPAIRSAEQQSKIVAPQPDALPDKPDPVQAELVLAKEAFSQGRYLEPQGESALDLYRSALALDPDSEAAKAGIRSVVDKILERAEAALTAERLEEAIRNIETARDIDETHSRLSFLDTQIARERERLKLSQARDVGNRVRGLITQASDRVQAGHLITPTGTSARDALLEARRLDPTDPTIAQGIRDLNAGLIEEARKSLAAGKPEEAQTFVSAARQLGSAGPALAAVERALAETLRSNAVPAPAPAESASRRPATAASPGPNIDAMVSSVRQRVSEGNLIDPAGASAKDALFALRDAAPTRPEVEELSRALSARLLEVGKQALAAKEYDRSAQFMAAARDVGARYNEAAISEAELDLVAARQREIADTVLAAANLRRIREVPAKYPTQAELDHIEGWVDIDFTISAEGVPQDLTVRNSKPRRIFDRAALDALRQWRFEPVVRNGEAVAQRAVLRVRFELK